MIEASRPTDKEQARSTQPTKSLRQKRDSEKAAYTADTPRSHLSTSVSQRTLRVIVLSRTIPLVEKERRANLRIINRIRHKIILQISIIETSSRAVREKVVDNSETLAVRALFANRKASFLRSAVFDVAAAGVAAVVALDAADRGREGERWRGGGYGAGGVVEVVGAAGCGEGRVVVGGEVVFGWVCV